MYQRRVCFSNLINYIPSFAPIIIRGQEVDVVPEAKLLGVVLSDNLKCNRHIDYICKKAAKRLYGLRLLKGNALPSHILFSIYCTLMFDQLWNMLVRCGIMAFLST